MLQSAMCICVYLVAHALFTCIQLKVMPPAALQATHALLLKSLKTNTTVCILKIVNFNDPSNKKF